MVVSSSTKITGKALNSKFFGAGFTGKNILFDFEIIALGNG